MTGIASMQHVYPETTGTYDLGISTKIFRNVFATTLWGSVNQHNVNELVDVMGTVAAGNVASFYDATGNVIQDSGAVAANLVTAASSTGVNGDVVTFTGARAVHDSGVLLSSLLPSATAATTYIPGPGAVTSGHLASFSGTTGLAIQDSGVPSANVVTAGSSTGVSGDVVTFSGSRAVQDSGVLLSSLLPSATAATTYIAGAGTVVANDIAVFSGTSGLNLNDSGVSIVSGKVTATTYLSTSPSAITSWSGTGAGSLTFTASTPRAIPATYSQTLAGNGDFSLTTGTGVMTYTSPTTRYFLIIWYFTMIPLSSTSDSIQVYINQGTIPGTPVDWIDVTFYTVTANFQPYQVSRLVQAAHNDTFQLCGQLNGGTSAVVFKEMKCVIVPVN